MKEQKLLSMVDRVEEVLKELEEIESPSLRVRAYGRCLDKIEAHKDFLKQLLTPGMFVPCDLEGNVLEEPIGWEDYLRTKSQHYLHRLEKCQQFQQAQERVLFEGWDDVKTINSVIKGKSIEWLVEKGFELDLTPTACKQIGYE